MNEEDVRTLARERLESGKVNAILGLRENKGHVAPYLFTEVAELDSLVVSPRYFISNISQRYRKNLLYILQERYPKAKIGVVARECDERALIELAKRNQLDLGKTEIIGVNCTRCRGAPVEGCTLEGLSSDVDAQALLKKSLPERLAFWKHELSKCIKCYGCRTVCPSCFCEDCELEQDLWVRTGELPPEMPMFHFIRWYHIADRCIECGECEKVCPVGIPLLTIFRLLRGDIKEMFGYEAGLDVGEEAPLLTKLDEASIKEG